MKCVLTVLKMCQMKRGVLSKDEVQINRSIDEMKCASEKMCGRIGSGVEGDNCWGEMRGAGQGASSSPVRKCVKES